MRNWFMVTGVVALAIACMPMILYSGSFEVEVTWSIPDEETEQHRLVVGDQMVTIPVGEKVTGKYRLRGGGKRAFLWGTRGFGPRGVRLEGSDAVVLTRVISSSGHWEVLGMGPKKTMEVECEIFEIGDEG